MAVGALGPGLKLRQNDLRYVGNIYFQDFSRRLKGIWPGIFGIFWDILGYLGYVGIFWDIWDTLGNVGTCWNMSCWYVKLQFLFRSWVMNMVSISISILTSYAVGILESTQASRGRSQGTHLSASKLQQCLLCCFKAGRKWWVSQRKTWLWSSLFVYITVYGVYIRVYIYTYIWYIIYIIYTYICNIHIYIHIYIHTIYIYTCVLLCVIHWIWFHLFVPRIFRWQNTVTHCSVREPRSNRVHIHNIELFHGPPNASMTRSDSPVSSQMNRVYNCI